MMKTNMSADLTSAAELTGSQLLYAHGLMAMLGALVHAANAHRTGVSKSFVDFVLLAFMSSFSGIMFFLVSTAFLDSGYLTIALTGAGSYMGMEGLTWIISVLKTILTTRVAK
jgi:hypothetical protein